MKRILVVDDDPQLRTLLVDTLQTIGYQSAGVTDGCAALKLLRSETYDLVISDISMPCMDGLELAANLRRQHPHLGVLLITGVGTREIEERAKRDRLCDGYLEKPFRIDRIEAMIDSVINRQQGSATPNGRGRVLVVDDDPYFLDSLVETVTSLGYRAEGALTSQAALNLLEREPASIVLADVSMPEMNGFDLLKMIKRTHPQTPVVIMTGHNLSEPAAALIKETADAYLTKPFRQEAIQAVLSQLEAR